MLADEREPRRGRSAVRRLRAGAADAVELALFDSGGEVARYRGFFRASAREALCELSFSCSTTSSSSTRHSATAGASPLRVHEFPPAFLTVAFFIQRLSHKSRRPQDGKSTPIQLIRRAHEVWEDVAFVCDLRVQETESSRELTTARSNNKSRDLRGKYWYSVFYNSVLVVLRVDAKGR